MTKNLEIYDDGIFRVVEANFEGFNGKRVIKYRIYFNNMYLGTVYEWRNRFKKFTDMSTASFTIPKNSSNLYLER